MSSDRVEAILNQLHFVQSMPKDTSTTSIIAAVLKYRAVCTTRAIHGAWLVVGSRETRPR